MSEDELSPQDAERRRMDEVDRRLMERFLAREPAAERELCFRLNGLFERVCRRDSRWLLPSFVEFRGQAYELLGDWRESGKLRLSESLPYLARRIWGQCADKELRRRKAERRSVSTELGWETPDDPGLAKRRERLEVETSEAAGEPSPEDLVAERQTAQWLVGCRERISEIERATFDAELQVSEGEAESLALALGVSEAAARKRRQRMREAIVALAEADGVVELLERARSARSTRRDKGVTRGGPNDE